MSTGNRNIEHAATDWFAQLSSDQTTEADWEAFRDWLETSPDHQTAYDRVERLWLALDDARPLVSSPFIRPLTDRERRRRIRAPAVFAAAVVAVAASVGFLLRAEGERSFRSGPDQPMAVELSKGNAAVLSPATTLTAKRIPGGEEATLITGAARFSVTHDPRRLFLVKSGGFIVSDVGTVFDVAALSSGLKVVVKAGEVAVAAPARPPIVVSAGETYQAEGATPPSIVKTAVAAPSLGGDLVFDNQPLSVVVSDLNRRFSRRVAVDAAAGRLRFSGVLALDEESAVIRRLESFLPITANYRDSAIVIHRRAGAH